MIEGLFALGLMTMLFVGLGKVIFKALGSEGSFPEVIIVGASALIVVLNLLNRFYPASRFSIFLFCGLIGVFLYLTLGAERWTTFAKSWHLYLMLIVGACFRIGFAVNGHSIVSIEPTSNHDDIYYIYTASWLGDHVFGGINSFVDRSIPFQYSAPINSKVLPRVGAESMTAFLANGFNMGVHGAYVVLNALGLSLLCLGILNISAKDVLNKKETLIKYVLIYIIPSVGFVWANNNFPTLWGLVFLCGIQYQVSFQRYYSKEKLLKIAILIAGLACTYPELFTVVFFIFCYFFIFDKNISLLSKSYAILFVGFISILLAPFAFADVFRVAQTTITATSRSAGYFFDYQRALILPYQIIDYVGSSSDLIALGWKYAISVFILAALLACGGGKIGGVQGTVLGCAALLAYMLLKNDSYGLMKAIEFSSVPVSVIVSRIIYELFEGAHEGKLES